MSRIVHVPPDAEPWSVEAIPLGPRGEARDLPLAALIQTVDGLGQALELERTELAGILGISEAEWSMFIDHRPDVGADRRIEMSLRLLCELLGSVLAFARDFDGARWLRTRHPLMGDSPLGRLIRTSSALPWLSAVLFEERGA